MSITKCISRIASVLFIIVLMMVPAVGALHVTPVHAAPNRFATQEPAGTRDCSSWLNACTFETALAGAVAGDEIWVAAGKYKPTTGTIRSATFSLKSGVSVYGGFSVGDTGFDQRNWTTHRTTLSGDIGTTDDPSDNAYHVVTANGVDASAVLDGFTIEAGNADTSGGGMINSSSSPTLRNLIFSSNKATSYGGGLYNLLSHPTLTNITFANNKADWGGGLNNNASNSVLTNVTFSGNTAGYAGGMIAWNGSSPSLTNVTFSGNSADVEGGGMIVWDPSSPTLTNVTFSGNTAQHGGGFYNHGGSPQIRNTIFWNNTATLGGAQIYNDSGTPSLSYSVLAGVCPGTCTHMVTANPMLGALGNYGGLTQTFSLLPGSSAIDAGDDLVCPVIDQRGITRPQGVHCDIGAFEVINQPPTISLSDITTTLPENYDTSSATHIADIAITDDGIGNNVLSLSGSDASLFEIVSGVLRLKAGTAFDFETKPTLNVTVAVSDSTIGVGPQDTKSLVINITNVNETPTNISLSNSSVPENSPINTLVGTLSSTDPDAGNTFSYALVAGSGDTDNAAFNISGSSLRTSAVFDYETKNSYSVRIRTTDQGGLSAEKVFAITVTNVNEAPTDITLSNQTVAENSAINTLVGTLSSTDPDAGDTFSYALVAGTGDTDNAAFNISGSSLRTSAVFDYETKSSYSVRMRTTDQGGLSAEKVFTITVTNVNDAPVANAQSVTTAVNTAKAITLTGSDVEGDPLTYTVISGPTHGELSGMAPALTYTPAADYIGPDSFTFKVSDGTLDSAPATVSITVSAVNHAPLANAQSVSSAEDTAKDIILTGSDVDGDPLTYTVVTRPAHGALSGTAPSLTYTPAANYNGADSFTFKVSDGTLDSAHATVSITVSAVNDAPLANARSITTAENTAKAITLLGSDVDGDPLTYAVVSGPAHGALSGTAPDLTYTPATDYNGADSFTFKVNDGTVDSAPATVSIIVSAAARADLAITHASIPAVVAPKATWAITLNISNSGPAEAANLSLSDTLPSGVTFVSAAGGSWTCAQASGVLHCTLPVLAAGNQTTLTITLEAPAVLGPLTNQAVITSSVVDPVSENNTSSASTTVASIPVTGLTYYLPAIAQH